MNETARTVFKVNSLRKMFAAVLIVDVKTLRKFFFGFLLGIFAFFTVVQKFSVRKPVSIFSYYSVPSNANISNNSISHMEGEKISLEADLADKLFNEVKILCLIMTNPNNHKKKAVHIKSLWGQKCNKLLFITSQPDDELETIQIRLTNDSRKALRNKTRDAFMSVHDKYLDDIDWVIKADDDKYV